MLELMPAVTSTLARRSLMRSVFIQGPKQPTIVSLIITRLRARARTRTRMMKSNLKQRAPKTPLKN